MFNYEYPFLLIIHSGDKLIILSISHIKLHFKMLQKTQNHQRNNYDFIRFIAIFQDMQSFTKSI